MKYRKSADGLSESEMGKEKFKERENNQKKDLNIVGSHVSMFPCLLQHPLMCAEAWEAVSLVHMRTFGQTDFSILLPFRQCVDIRIQRNSSLPWTQIHIVLCHFVCLGLSAIARTFPRASNVPVDPQWTQKTNVASGNAHGKGGREMWSQGEEGLVH